jgi:hypothetical protein
MSAMRLSTRMALALLAGVLTLALDPVATLCLGQPRLTSAHAKRHHYRRWHKRHHVRRRHKKHRKASAPPTEM